MISVVILQARMGAERLPGKVLLPLGRDVVLGHVCARANSILGIDNLIIATTTDMSDNIIAEWADNNNTNCFRGSHKDVLSRYYHAAKQIGADIIIRITSDCPCIDPEIVSSMLKDYLTEKPDYMSNTLSRTFPHGMDAEIFSFDALEKSFKEAGEQPYREHVTPYIYRSGEFKCLNYINNSYKGYEDKIRVTLDTPSDYALISVIYNMLGPSFSFAQLIALYNEYSWLKNINDQIIQKEVYDSISDEIQAALALLKTSGMDRGAELLFNAFQRSEA